LVLHNLSVLIFEIILGFFSEEIREKPKKTQKEIPKKNLENSKKFPQKIDKSLSQKQSFTTAIKLYL
jgi:hypothetical protein